MARSFLVFALIPLIPASLAVAEPTPIPKPVPQSSPSGTPREDGHGRKDRGPRDSDMDRRPPPDENGDGQSGRFKKRLEQMSPDERQHFLDNWKRWKEMGDGERKDWQQRAMDERNRMKKVIDDAIQGLGLKLDDDQREVFVLRYRQERRKIEEQLCQEMTAKRESEINEMLQRLKNEFSAPRPTPTPAPAAEKPAAKP